MTTELSLSARQRPILSELLKSFRGTCRQAMDTAIITLDVKDTCPGIHFRVYVGHFFACMSDHLSLIWRTLKILFPADMSICIAN